MVQKDVVKQKAKQQIVTPVQLITLIVMLFFNVWKQTDINLELSGFVSVMINVSFFILILLFGGNVGGKIDLVKKFIGIITDRNLSPVQKIDQLIRLLKYICEELNAFYDAEINAFFASLKRDADPVPELPPS
jgi:hypothetical protein